LTRFAHEKQIFRIDHYLGKETVQNILMFRFSNAIFEQLWGRQSVDHIQLTVSEKLGVGSRGSYYEETGALRDMVQNHLLQVLALVAMEPPVSLEAESIRDEKVKLLRSIRSLHPAQVPTHVVRGQYTAGAIGAEPRRVSAGIKPTQRRNVRRHEAFVTIGDGRACLSSANREESSLSSSEVRVQFRPTPNVLFAAHGSKLDANAITLRFKPNQGLPCALTARYRERLCDSVSGCISAITRNSGAYTPGSREDYCSRHYREMNIIYPQR
jgi:glucose-6-phosphate 1-dehydrogenase